MSLPHKLASEIEQLGIAVPSEIVDLPTASPADDVEAIIDGVLNADILNTQVAFEIRHALDRSLRFLTSELAKRGVDTVHTDDRGGGLADSIVGVDRCTHLMINISVERDRVQCRECKAFLAPTWWLARYAATIQRMQAWYLALSVERKRLNKEIADLRVERGRLKQAVKRAKK